MSRADFLSDQRAAAWATGRSLANQLLGEYCAKYHPLVPPPPATVVDELLTEFLGCQLEYAPLNLNVFAQTEWIHDATIVTVNSRTAAIPGVKDIVGVENVAKWHEVIHVTRDEPVRGADQGVLVGFESPRRIVCSRGEQAGKSPAIASREFWAEEAGRAAAVSFRHLRRSGSFMRLMRSAGGIPNGSAWQCLIDAATDIGVNRSALVTQLELEGLVVVEKIAGKQILHVQPSLGSVMESA